MQSYDVVNGRNELVAKVIFLHLSVILFTEGVCLSACWDAPPPPRRPTQKEAPPCQGDPPRQGDPPGIRSMSGRYASYWNAFLFTHNVK